MLPPRELNPNWRGHWGDRAHAAQAFRHAARVCALNDSRFSHPSFSRARVTVKLYVPDRRHRPRDLDNLLASLKPAMDGCIDAGIIRDDAAGSIEYCSPVVHVVDPARAPLTVLEFEEVLA